LPFHAEDAAKGVASAEISAFKFTARFRFQSAQSEASREQRFSHRSTDAAPQKRLAEIQF
jgi:hypothetical protein